MQQSDVLYQCESQALSQGLDQSQSPAQPQDRANEPAAQDATAGAAKKGSAEDAAKGIAAGVSTNSTTAGKLGAAEKGSAAAGESAVALEGEPTKGVAAGVSTGSTAAGKGAEKESARATATETPAAEKVDLATAGECEPAAKVSAAAKGSEPAAEEPKKSWFVMRDLKRANAKMPAYKLLMEKEIEVFTPMHTVLKVVKGRQQKVQEPFVRDLLFVHDTRAAIDPIVEVTPTLQYRYERGKGYKVPMVVRDAEMNRFILAVTASKSTKYYTPGELSPNMIGRNVRISGGPLEGYAGKLLKINGSRTKRLLVQLEGILSAGVEVDAQYIELL